MSEIKQIVADIQTVFGESSYPQDFLDSYDQMECLSSHSGRETFLIRRKSDGEQLIAKCYDRELFPYTPDFSLLKSLSGPGLPTYAEQFRNEKMLCIIREYIEGVPLNRYAREKRLRMNEILPIANQLCDVLERLHSHNPPIIHRDLKPENIIVQPDGTVVLIDFDIARAVKDDAEKDTVSFGTRGYAPPEQFGFEQTDQKADIYSFGVLLRWLVTGSVQPNSNIRMDPVLEQIIAKCTAFSPKDRYGNIRQVRRELQLVGKEARKPNRKTLLSIGCTALLFLCLGFVLGRFTGILTPPPPQEPAVTFTEPLIEKAVRAQLGADESAVLTQDMLMNVRTLYIYGTEVYSDPDSFYQQDPADHQRGSVHSLNDLTLLPNLERLFLVYQGPVNISALSQIQSLRTVEIKHTQLEDIYPLSEINMLTYVGLFDTGLEDVTALENCRWMDTLDIGYNPIRDMSHVGKLAYLTNLTLRGIRMDSLDGIEALTELRQVTLAQAVIGDCSALRKLPNLERVYITAEHEETIRAVLDGCDVEIILTDH